MAHALARQGGAVYRVSVDKASDLRQDRLMRGAFAHEAVISMQPGADVRAPGAAITVALCGHWQHQPPCPLAPHHTRSTRAGGDVHVRTLFAAEPALESEVRQRIGTALAGGELVGPDGEVTHWQLHTSQPSAVLANETEHARRLATG